MPACMVQPRQQLESIRDIADIANTQPPPINAHGTGVYSGWPSTIHERSHYRVANMWTVYIDVHLTGILVNASYERTCSLHACMRTRKQTVKLEVVYIGAYICSIIVEKPPFETTYSCLLFSWL